jgi:hypothetical protein
MLEVQVSGGLVLILLAQGAAAQIALRASGLMERQAVQRQPLMAVMAVMVRHLPYQEVL